MIIYLAGGYLTPKHRNYLWSYYYAIDSQQRYGAVKDFERFKERMEKSCREKSVMPVEPKNTSPE